MKTTVVLALCAIAAFAVAARVGGFSDVKPVDESVQVVFESAEGMAAVGKAFGLNVYSLRVVAYRTQVVAGVNYRVEAVVNDDTSVYISAFKPLPHTGDPLQITSVLAKTPGDQL